ncbi:MAG: hypothetical protein ABJC13_24235 [Acidobacteriota bacterium]
MQAHKQAMTMMEDPSRSEAPREFSRRTGGDNRVEIPEPPDTISAERRRLLDVIEDVKSTRLTSEEEFILDYFENFRAEHPFQVSDLSNS